MNARRQRTQRGTALPETAVIGSLALLLMLGAIQLSLLGFGQTSADGAAFIAAVADSTGYANPQGLAATIFPGIKQSNIALNASGGTVIGTATTTLPGIAAVPGFSGTVTLQGADIEPYTATSQGIAPAPFTFAVDANLANYCVGTGGCTSNYPITLAQHLNPNGNGINGQFTEWQCHASTYSSVKYPATLPSPGPTWDITNTNSTEYTIYSWDSGASC